jgi:hypothetical protein
VTAERRVDQTGTDDVGADAAPRAFPGKQQRHGPAVSDRIGRGIERPLSAADDQDPAALPAAAAAGFTPWTPD